MVNKGKRKNPYEYEGTSKRLQESGEDEYTENGIFTNLPHEILLKIFKLLSISERCRLARVCKSWLRTCYDETLWYHIDLSASILDLKHLWKLFRHQQFTNAKSIKICGNLKNSNYYFSKFLLKIFDFYKN